MAQLLKARLTINNKTSDKQPGVRMEPCFQHSGGCGMRVVSSRPTWDAGNCFNVTL